MNLSMVQNQQEDSAMQDESQPAQPNPGNVPSLKIGGGMGLPLKQQSSDAGGASKPKLTGLGLGLDIKKAQEL